MPTYAVLVNRSFSGKQAIRHSGRVLSGNMKITDTMPMILGSDVVEVRFVLFKPRYVLIEPEELELERQARGLQQDIGAQIQVNRTYPDLAGSKPNGDCWKDIFGLWHSIYFHKHEADNLDCLNLYNSVHWNHKTWFGGVEIK